MQNISLEDLDTVTGGLTGGSISPGPTTPTSTSSSGSSTNDALLTSLNSLSSSIKDLSKNNNQGLFSGNGMLMFGMAMMLSRQSSSTVVVNGGGGRCHGGFGYSWHARW